jgi:hypothetical protein
MSSFPGLYYLDMNTKYGIKTLVGHWGECVEKQDSYVAEVCFLFSTFNETEL